MHFKIINSVRDTYKHQIVRVEKEQNNFFAALQTQVVL